MYSRRCQKMAAEHPHDYQKLIERQESVEAALSLQGEVLAAAKREIERKDQIIAELQRRLFGSKSERIDPSQYQLEFGEEVMGKPEPLPPIQDGGEGGQEEEGEKGGAARSRRKKGELFPRNLPVIVDRILVPGEVESDPGAWIEIGEEYHDKLEVVKAAIYIQRIVRKKYKCKDDRSRPPLIAPAPEPGVPGTMAGSALIAMIVADKYADHLPHYRQADRFLRRFGVELSRQTINVWTHSAAELLAPVYAAVKLELQQARVLQIDETPMDYLSPGLGRTAQGYFWFYRDAETGTVYCDWQLGRGHQCMFDILGIGDPAGMLLLETIQCDGYSAYEALSNRLADIKLAACLAHIRRKFFESREQAPAVTGPILELIAELYRIERWLRYTGAPPDCRELVRRASSLPVADTLKEHILKERAAHFPKSKLGEAVAYALNQWEQFERYLYDGRLEIDNNLIENAIRPAKLGLKNYLFIGNAEAGVTSALFYTLLGNCKALGIDPELYLAEALDRMTLRTTPEEAAELTPAKLAGLIRSRQPVPRGREEDNDPAVAA